MDIPYEYLQRPALYLRDGLPFWDDEHISKGMLAAHLDPSVDAASSRPETITRCVAWLAKVIRSGARVLDLGCGPGLYTKRLAALGYRVTGMDVSGRSIAYARAQDDKSDYICQDYLTLDVKERFDAVTLIYCDYAALTGEERARLLAGVRAALRSGGLFIFDVFTEAHFRRKTEERTWEACPQGGFWHAAPYMCLNARYLYGERLVTADRHVVFSRDGVADHIVWDTAFTRHSLTEELQRAGLRVMCIYGDLCGTPFDGDGDTLCCVAGKL